MQVYVIVARQPEEGPARIWFDGWAEFKKVQAEALCQAQRNERALRVNADKIKRRLKKAV